MVEVNAAYIRNQIAKLAYQDPRGDGFEQVFPDIPVGPDVNQDCCSTDGGNSPLEMPCAGMFIYIWTSLVPDCLRQQKKDDPAVFLEFDSLEAFQVVFAESQKFFIKNLPWKPEDLSLSPEDLVSYNDANSDFPTTIPPYLNFGDCEVDIWKVIPYSDKDFKWPRTPDGVPYGPELPGDRENRKTKLREIMECFRRFYEAVAEHNAEQNGSLNWDLNNPCCSIQNFKKMMIIMRLFSCLSLITTGNIPSAVGGESLLSGKLREKMLKCINCIEKKCFSVA